MSTVSGILQCRPHLEPTRGTPRQACDYVSKEDTRIPGPSLQHGDPPVTANGQGRRNDLLTVKHQIDSGVPVLSIAENDEHFGTVIANERSLQAYAHHKSAPAPTEPVVLFFMEVPALTRVIPPPGQRIDTMLYVLQERMALSGLMATCQTCTTPSSLTISMDGFLTLYCSNCLTASNAMSSEKEEWLSLNPNLL